MYEEICELFSEEEMRQADEVIVEYKKEQFEKEIQRITDGMMYYQNTIASNWMTIANEGENIRQINLEKALTKNEIVLFKHSIQYLKDQIDYLNNHICASARVKLEYIKTLYKEYNKKIENARDKLSNLEFRKGKSKSIIRLRKTQIDFAKMIVDNDEKAIKEYREKIKQLTN